MPKPRKHAKLIKKWADNEGTIVQRYDSFRDNWETIDIPKWHDHVTYRVIGTPQDIAIEALENIVDATTSSSNSGAIAREALKLIKESANNA